jgi:hypothetical protein
MAAGIEFYLVQNGCGRQKSIAGKYHEAREQERWRNYLMI